MKEYGFKEDTTHQAIIFEKGTEAETNDIHAGYTEGMVVGSSEWGWITKDYGRRICAALKYFSETSTDEIEKLADERFAKKNVDEKEVPHEVE